VLRPAGLSKPDLAKLHVQKNSVLERHSCESIRLARGNDGREVTDEEMEERIATFPIELADGGIGPRRLPLP
jgi:hypothetical protein